MGEKIVGGGGMADDMGEGMHCSDHPYRSNPGGICAFCLQEKLGKLVSSSKSSDSFFSIPPPPSSPSPTSFPPSDLPASVSSSAKHHRPKKNKPISSAHSTAVRLQKVAATSPNAGDLVLKRNKSVAPRPLGDSSYRTRKKSFWSFLTLSYTSSASSTALSSSVINKRRSTSSASSAVVGAVKNDDRNPRREQDEATVSSAAAIGDYDISSSGSQASSTLGRKLARSRSVGCGSRSFSGDFLERISNGLGDCALRRVESQRETKPKTSIHRRDRHCDVDDEEQGIKEQIKCGRIFGSLGTISSSTYWLPAASAADVFSDRLPATSRRGAPHSRNKSWAWAFASPMRAFRAVGSGGQTAIIAPGSASHGGRSGGVYPSMLVV